MVEEKDRFGDKLRDAERGREEDYFAKRDRELVDKLRRAQEGATAGQPAASGPCPRCTTGLAQRVLQGINVDECPACGGVWLDRRELEALVRAEPEQSWIVGLLRSSIRMR